MVGSLTNISLVPYEMLATGLPIFEFKEGTFNYFFPQGTAFVTSFDYNEFYEMFKYAISNPQILKEMNKASKAYLDTLSWQSTGKECVKILNEIQ